MNSEPMTYARGRISGRPTAAILRLLARDTEFTIISNNCWGAHIYSSLRIPYRTPFVGLFIPPQDYLQLVRRFDYYIQSRLSFASQSRLVHLNQWRTREGLSYPIGLLNGCVELHFQHYADEHQARAKWLRRCQRITPNPANRFFKFDDREGATTKDLRDFCSLPLAHKVCFTAISYDFATVVVPNEPGDVQVMDGKSLSETSWRYFNSLRWVSTLPKWAPLPSLL
jgi:uncharacterized protein (DUF1919 family)